MTFPRNIICLNCFAVATARIGWHVGQDATQIFTSKECSERASRLDKWEELNCKIVINLFVMYAGTFIIFDVTVIEIYILIIILLKNEELWKCVVFVKLTK